MKQYGAMAFLGWNTADEGQVARLTEYVRTGGVLVLGWPHLFTDTRREDAVLGTPHPLDASALTGVKLHGFRQAAAPGGPTLSRVTLGENARVLREEDGLPLVIENRLGAGTVYFVNAREYPADAGVRGVYEELLQMLGEREARLQREKGWLSSGDTVEAAAYDQEDGRRVIYAVNTGWYSQEETARGVLCAGGVEYPVEIRRGQIHRFDICGGVAVESSGWDEEVVSMERTEDRMTVVLQGSGEAVLKLYRGGTAEELRVCLDGVSRVTLPDRFG